MCKPEKILEKLREIDQGCLSKQHREIIQFLIDEIESDLIFQTPNKLSSRLDLLIDTTQGMIDNHK